MVDSLALKIPLFKVFLSPRDKLIPFLEQILYSGSISEGEYVYKFEDNFGIFIGNPNCISFYSGTAALHTALLILGVGPGDEVISTPATAEPTNLSILHAGGEIVWADVDSSTGNISPDSVRSKITEKTKAIIAVHYGGTPCDLDGLMSISKETGIPVLEDAAHALGASYKEKKIGSHSDIVMFSFQAIKHMTTVDGGMLACRDSDMCKRGTLIRWFGIDRQSRRTDIDVEVVGYKYHMNNVNASIGIVQLAHIDPVIEKHIENGKYFDEMLKGIDGVTLCRYTDGAEPSYWFYTLHVEDREKYIKYLNSEGIAASTVHKRNDSHSVFKEFKTELPGVDEFYRTMVHIPCGWWVSEDDREYIVDTIKGGW